MNVNILYEDDSFLLIDKPAGLITHPDGKTSEKTLCDWILDRYPHIKDVGEPLVLSNGEVIYRPGIVHRLDRETSGVLLIAKTHNAFAHFKSQFQEREAKKIYNAFVYGEMKDDGGVIDRPIGRSKKDFRLWSAQRGARGEMREAVTHYSVLLRGKGASFLEVAPKTGRTHQIRVHFKAINHPIVCDKLYAPKQECVLGFNRLALHARSLEFALPDGSRKKIEAPLPPDFVAALEEIKK
jgi:23S rRNA pseudouridine1911/1915/1917 synthase